MVSGHELGHAIDNTGRLFDKEGSLSRVEPWSEKELSEFKNLSLIHISFENNYIVIEKSWFERFIEPIVYKLREDLFFWEK